MNQPLTQSPFVEILIAAHNAGAYLLDSVRSALAQTYPNIVVSVIDDGSTDSSLDALAKIDDARLNIIRQPRSGKAAALNRALAHSTAAFVAIQDADDCSHPQRIELLVRAMQQHPEIAAVFSGHDLIINGTRSAPRRRAKSPDQVAADVAALRMPAHDPTVMFRRSMTRDIAFAESLDIGQGYDFVLRLGERFPMLVLDECLYSYRVHSASNTQRHRNRRIEFVLRVIERACLRRGCSRQQIDTRIAQELRQLQRCGPMNNIAAHMLESVLDQRDSGHRGVALRTACTAIAMQPCALQHYKPLIAAVAPRSMIDAWRARPNADVSPNETPSGEARPIFEIKPDAMPDSESVMTHSKQKVRTHV